MKNIRYNIVLIVMIIGSVLLSGCITNGNNINTPNNDTIKQTTNPTISATSTPTNSTSTLISDVNGIKVYKITRND